MDADIQLSDKQITVTGDTLTITLSGLQVTIDGQGVSIEAAAKVEPTEPAAASGPIRAGSGPGVIAPSAAGGFHVVQQSLRFSNEGKILVRFFSYGQLTSELDLIQEVLDLRSKGG
jgi:hypothetical protein